LLPFIFSIVNGNSTRNVVTFPGTPEEDLWHGAFEVKSSALLSQFW